MSLGEVGRSHAADGFVFHDKELELPPMAVGTTVKWEKGLVDLHFPGTLLALCGGPPQWWEVGAWRWDQCGSCCDHLARCRGGNGLGNTFRV